MKKIISVIIFIIGLNSILFYIAYTLLPKDSGYNAIDYYKNNNQLDIIWLGPSTTYWAISPMYIWNKYNITSFNNAHRSQGLTSFYLMQDMMKYNMDLIFFDITIFMTDNVIFNKNIEELHQWYLTILTRYQLIKDTGNNYLNILYLKLMEQFHSRWKNINEKEFINNEIDYYYLGQDSNIIRHRIQNQENKLKSITGKFKLNDNTIKFIDNMSRYIKDNNLNVVFWFPPTADQSMYERSFLFEEVIKKYDIPYINFSKVWKEAGIDYSKDFFNLWHINIDGGEKVADYLIEYAMKNYNIQSHKNDPAYASWNEDYIKYARAVNKAEINVSNTLNDWYNLSQYDNYTMLISTNGNNVFNRLPQDIKDKFKSLGLTKYETNKGNMKYAAIIDNGKVFYEEVSDKKVEYKGRMKNIVNLLVSSEPNKATINVSGKPRSKNKYGINFVIYDKVNREIVDSIWIDPRKPDAVRR